MRAHPCARAHVDVSMEPTAHLRAHALMHLPTQRACSMQKPYSAMMNKLLIAARVLDARMTKVPDALLNPNGFA